MTHEQAGVATEALQQLYQGLIYQLSVSLVGNEKLGLLSSGSL